MCCDDGFRGEKKNQNPQVLGVSTAALVGICRVEVNGGRKLGFAEYEVFGFSCGKVGVAGAGAGTKLMQLPLCPRVGVTACGEIEDQRGLFLVRNEGYNVTNTTETIRNNGR